MGDLSANQSAQAVYIMGADSTGVETYPIRATSNGGLKVAVSEFPDTNLDAFGNLVSIDRNIIFSNSFSKSDFNGLLWNNKTAGSGTVTLNTTTASLELKTTTTSGDEATTQTNRTMYYQPGQGMISIQTLTPATPKANLTQEWGLRCLVATNEHEGMWFRYNGITMEVVKSSKITGTLTETAITQTNWNTDKMDGTGPSGLTLDFTKGQIYFIDYQWLGYGAITFGIMYGKVSYPVHIIQHANTTSAPYTKSPSFKSFFSCRNTGTTSATSYMYPECTSVCVYGNSYLGQTTTPLGTDTSTININASSYTPLLGIKLRDSTTCTCELILQELDILVTSNTDIHYKLIYNPTITGGTWNNAGIVSSYNTTIASFSGGTDILAGYLNKQKFVDVAELTKNIRFGHLIDGTGIPLLVVAKTLSSNASVAVSGTVKELI